MAGSIQCIAYYAECDLLHGLRHTYAHLMTSRELTSGFEFWSGGYLRMAVVHLPIKFGVDIYISSPELLQFFFEIKNGSRRHLGFSVYVNLAIPAC